MRKVYLHGRLGDLFGHEWELDVDSVGEASRAIEANTKGFWKYLGDKANEKIHYRVVIGERDHESEGDLICKQGKGDDFHIIPVPETGEDAVNIIVGVVLVVIGVALNVIFPGNPFGIYFINVGAAMIIGGIAQLIIGKPELGADTENETSFLFNNQVNTVRQGGPIPLQYGEFMGGSQLINFFSESKELGGGAFFAAPIGGGGGEARPNFTTSYGVDFPIYGGDYYWQEWANRINDPIPVPMGEE